MPGYVPYGAGGGNSILRRESMNSGQYESEKKQASMKVEGKTFQIIRAANVEQQQQMTERTSGTCRKNYIDLKIAGFWI